MLLIFFWKKTLTKKSSNLPTYWPTYPPALSNYLSTDRAAPQMRCHLRALARRCVGGGKSHTLTTSQSGETGLEGSYSKVKPLAFGCQPNPRRAGSKKFSQSCLSMWLTAKKSWKRTILSVAWGAILIWLCVGKAFVYVRRCLVA